MSHASQMLNSLKNNAALRGSRYFRMGMSRNSKFHDRDLSKANPRFFSDKEIKERKLNFDRQIEKGMRLNRVAWAFLIVVTTICFALYIIGF